ncbi:MAG: BamA/TamA family outer membrane protein, partial [Proteobacteria bacterium]|nr:BamA/TamA family outer membrane protein [Pseudomonadota bacterium]
FAGRSRDRTHIYFSVDPGEISTVGAFQLVLESEDSELEAALEKAITLGAGSFDGADLRQSEWDLWIRLLVAGYVDAEVASRFDETSEKGVINVVFDVKPGEPCGCDGVELEGLIRVRRERAMSRALGRLVKNGRIRSVGQLEDRFADLEALDGGQLLPGGEVPLRIQLDEAPHSKIGPAGNFDITNGFILAQGGFEWSVRHLGGGLSTFLCRTRLGYSVLPNKVSHFEDHGPLTDQILEWEIPASVAHGLSLFVGGLGATDVKVGYHSVMSGGNLGMRWKPTKGLKFELGYHVEYWHYFPFAGQKARFLAAFTDDVDWQDPNGPRLRRNYLLNQFRFLGELDLRDRTLDPHRGFLARTTVAPYGLAGDKPWVRSTLDLRGYVPLTRRNFTLAMRLYGGIFRQYGNSEGLGLHSRRLFIGGPTTVRGWSKDDLAAPGFPGDERAVQLGGDVLLMSSVELRARPHRSLHLVAFADVGRVWSTPYDIYNKDNEQTSRGVRLSDLQPAVGGGVRLPVPFGTVRLELAYRVRDDGNAANPPWRTSIVFGLADIF